MLQVTPPAAHRALPHIQINLPGCNCCAAVMLCANLMAESVLQPATWLAKSGQHDVTHRHVMERSISMLLWVLLQA